MGDLIRLFFPIFSSYSVYVCQMQDEAMGGGNKGQASYSCCGWESAHEDTSPTAGGAQMDREERGEFCSSGLNSISYF